MTTLETTCRYPFVPEMGGVRLLTAMPSPLQAYPPFPRGLSLSLEQTCGQGNGAYHVDLFPVDSPRGLEQIRFSPSHCAPCPPSHSPTWRLSAVFQLLQWAGLSCSASPMRRHMPSILPATLRLRYSGRGTLIRRTADNGCRPIPGIPARTFSTVIS